MSEALNRHFTKGDIQINGQYMKRCQQSLLIWEMQLKNTIKYHLITVKKVILKKKNTGEKKEKNKRNISVVKDVEKKYICTVGRNVNCCNRYGSSPEH